LTGQKTKHLLSKPAFCNPVKDDFSEISSRSLALMYFLNFSKNSGYILQLKWVNFWCEISSFLDLCVPKIITICSFYQVAENKN